MNTPIPLTMHGPTHSSPNPFENPSPLNQSIIRKKVAICGFEEQNNRTAPYDDPEWDVWGFNMANRLGFMHDGQGRFRADRWFDLHEAHAQSSADMAWINSCPVPLYLPTVFGVNPLARAYPLEWVCQKLKGPAYFASSFAYAVALALVEGYSEIGLFGVNLDWGRERVVERGNLEYWMGIAAGMGRTLHLSPGSKLCTHPGLYGLEYAKEKEGVIEICATVIRQLLQDRDADYQSRFDADVTQRVTELLHLRSHIDNLVQRVIYQSKE